jgi:hypothetical protein
VGLRRTRQQPNQPANSACCIRLARTFPSCAEQRYGLQSPIEALLHHEIVGHIVPVLAEPMWLKRPWLEIEAYAVARENEYRKHVGLELVPGRMPSP